jgi:extradiol dioxygenase family protein
MSAIAVPLACSHCGKTFYGPRFSVMQVTDRNHAIQLQHFFDKLVTHIQAEHRERGIEVGMAEAEFHFMMVMSNFRSDDQELARKLDISRWNVHQKTLAVKITDQMIRDCVEQVLPDLKTLVSTGDDAKLRSNLFELMAGLRRQLEEPHKYDLVLEPLETAKAN